MKRLNKEEQFIAKIVIFVAISLAVIIPARRNVALHEETAVESAYEAGYSRAMEDVVSMSTIVETWEKDGDCHITMELPNGEIHEFVSPKALG